MERPDLIINYWAILVSAIGYCVLGTVWYSESVFGKIWAESAGIEPKKDGMVKKILITFAAALVVAFVMAHLMAYSTYFTGVGGIMGGIQVAFWGWLGLTAATYLITIQFEDKPFKFYLVNTGYHLAGLILTGIILGIWS